MSSSRTKKATATVIISGLGNLLIALVKLIAGILGNSFALIADAVESCCDVFSSIVVYLGLRYSSRPADKNHPYGHGKVEALTTFFVVIVLVVAAIYIAIQAIINIRTPHSLPEPYTLIVLGAVIVYKECFYRYVDKKGKDVDSTSLKADAWHHRSDAISSLAAFIGISIALLLGDGYENLDDWASLVASGIILINAYLILRPALGELLDEQQYDDLASEIGVCAGRIEGVIDTEHCNIRKFGMNYIVDIHVRVPAHLSVYEGHTIAHKVKNEIMKLYPQIYDVFTHIEPK